VKISIITVCLNSENLIESTIKSVIEQSAASEIEYIIIDGGSSDSTLDIINKYKKNISVVVSEKDSGIYNAMNKAIDFAKGDYLLFLNSGDILNDSKVIEEVMEFIAENNNYDLFFGNVALYSQHKGFCQNLKFNNITKRKLFKKNICHQGIFYKKELFEKFGKYNQNYKIYADYDYNLKLILKEKVKFKHFDRIISNFLLGGVSSNKENLQKNEKEHCEVIKKYYSNKEIYLYNLAFKIQSCTNNRLIIKIINKIIEKLID